MANKTPQAPVQTKKHLARMERERILRRYLIIAFVAVLVLSIGLLLYGLFFQSFIQARQPVAVVNGENITTQAWQERVRFQRANLVNSALRNYEFSQMMTDPTFQVQIANQLQQLKFQMEPASLGNTVVNSMVDELVILKEAEKRGISVTQAEIDNAIGEAFGFYPNGTPTAQPTEAPIATSTLNSLQQTLIPPTPTASPTPVITAESSTTQEASATPLPATPTALLEEATVTVEVSPTATPASLDEMENYKQVIEEYRNSYNIAEGDFRSILQDIFKAQLLRVKLQEAVIAELDLPTSSEQVWARHILVEDEQLAGVIYEKLQKGENFCEQAATYSTDTSNKDQCGDLGWFGKGMMVAEFEQAAFALQPGEISKPVKSQFGYHIIQLLGKEDRPISQSEFDSTAETRFQEWLDELKTGYQIEVLSDRIASRSPSDPAWPVTLDSWLQSVQLQQQQIQQQQLTPQP